MKLNNIIVIFSVLSISLLICIFFIQKDIKDKFICPESKSKSNEQEEEEEDYSESTSSFGKCTDKYTNRLISNLEKSIKSVNNDILSASTNCPLNFTCNKLATDLRDCINDEEITSCPFPDGDLRCKYDDYTNNINNTEVLLPSKDANNIPIENSLEQQLIMNARMNTSLDYSCNEFETEKSNIQNVVRDCRSKFINNSVAEKCVNQAVNPSTASCSNKSVSNQINFLNISKRRNEEELRMLQCGCVRCANLPKGRMNSQCFALCSPQNKSASKTNNTTKTTTTTAPKSSGTNSSASTKSNNQPKTSTGTSNSTKTQTLSGATMKEGTNPIQYSKNNVGGVEAGSSKYLNAPSLGYEISEAEMKSIYGNRPGQVSSTLPYTDVRTADKGPLILDSQGNKDSLDSLFGNIGGSTSKGTGNGTDNRQYAYAKRDSYSRGPVIKQDNIDGVSNVFSPHIIINPPIFGMDTNPGHENISYSYGNDFF